MANELTGVVLSIHVKLPKSNLIKVEEVLVDGSGTLTEALQGGQSKIGITLTSGAQLRPLTMNESVFVRGVMNGNPFTLPGPLQVTHPQKPWEIGGTIGSSGP